MLGVGDLERQTQRGGLRSGALTSERDNKAKLTIEHVALDRLKPDPFNPRRISDQELDALTRSIQSFGLVDPIIARREDRAVIGGHQRLLAARRLGLAEVPVLLVNLAPERAKLLNLALNRISGDWDQGLLARLLAELNETLDVDITLSGFAEDEIAKLLKSLDSRERRERPETFDFDAAWEEAAADPAMANPTPCHNINAMAHEMMSRFAHSSMSPLTDVRSS